MQADIHDQTRLRQADQARPLPQHARQSAADRLCAARTSCSCSSSPTARSRSRAPRSRRRSMRARQGDQADCRAAGFSARSGFLTSSAFGGISWLAHSTLQSGVWVNSQRRYNQLDRTATASRSATRSSGRGGGRSTSRRPTITTGRRGRRSTTTTSSTTGVTSVTTAPLSPTRRCPTSTCSRRCSASSSSKQQPPPAVRGGRHGVEPHAVEPHPPADPLEATSATARSSTAIPMDHETGAFWSNPTRVKAAYGRSIEYSLNSLISFVQHYGNKNLVMVVVGDHQPLPIVSGQRLQPRRADLDHRPRPDGAQADRELGLGVRACGPSPNAPVWPMSAFRNRFFTAFDSQARDPVAVELSALRGPHPAELGLQPVLGDSGWPAWTASGAWPRCTSWSTTSSCARSPAIRSTTRRSGPAGSSTGVSRSSCSSCCRASRWPCRRPATAGGWTRSPGSRGRRARRILPPYWAALAFSLAVAWLVVPQPGHGVPDAKSVVVNGLLVQNIVGAPSPNAAFWSMAVEAQLYLLFPLLLLMVRRWGAIAMVATVTLVVAAVGIFGPHVSRLDTFVIQSPPDLAALFAVGILTRRHRRRERGSPVVAVGLARARRRGARARDDLVAGLGVDARPPVLGRPRAGPGDRVPAGRSGHRPSGAAPAPARHAADPQPRLVVVQPVPDARPDRGHRLRDGSWPAGSAQGVPGLRRHARPGAAADDRVRAGLRVGLRDARSRQRRSAPGAARPRRTLEQQGVPG